MRPKVTCTTRKWESRMEPPRPRSHHLWATVSNDFCPSAWTSLGQLGWWGSCPWSRVAEDFTWALSHPSSPRLSSRVCLLYWLRIAKRLYWRQRTHFATQLPRPCWSGFLCWVRFCSMQFCCVPLLPLLSSFLLPPGVVCTMLLLSVFPFCAVCSSRSLNQMGSRRAASVRQRGTLELGHLGHPRTPLTY